MDEKYEKYARYFKVLSDPYRLTIVDMLSGGEPCACIILEKLPITQPTLSHHMKTLCDCVLVNSQKEDKWMHYSINDESARGLEAFLDEVTTAKGNRI